MNPILNLLVAHFLADFTFQPQWLAAFKKRYWWGVLLHAFIHFAVMAALLFPFLKWPSAWMAIALIAVSHLGIDREKIRLSERHRMHPLLMYLADQLLHFVILLLVAVYFFNPLAAQIDFTLPWFFTDSSVLVYLLVATLATYAYDMTRWTYRSSRKPQPYKRDYRIILINGFIVTIAFVLYWVTR